MFKNSKGGHELKVVASRVCRKSRREREKQERTSQATGGIDVYYHTRGEGGTVAQSLKIREQRKIERRDEII